MMNIENVWQQSSGSDDALNKVLKLSNYKNLQSKLPLNKLKKNLLIGIIWAILITAFYIALFFVVDIWQVYIALIILIISNAWIAIDSWKLYKNMNVAISATNSLKAELQKNYNGVTKWWLIQQKASLFVYPIALTGGFILGSTLGSNQGIEKFLYNPKMWSILGITILIVMPICYYSAKWMFNYTYGKHLKKLKMFIDELN